MDNENQTIFITSHNQSGGITAHTVVVGNQQRHLTNLEKSAIQKEVEDLFRSNNWQKNKLFYVSIPMDNESKAYADDVGWFLYSLGYSNLSIVQEMMSTVTTSQNYKIYTQNISEHESAPGIMIIAQANVTR